jgi:hypothetical protein
MSLEVGEINNEINTSDSLVRSWERLLTGYDKSKTKNSNEKK